MIAAIAGLALPIVAMRCVFRAARLRQAAHSRLLTLALATCLGIGASSAVTFVTLMAGGRLDRWFVVRDVLLWVAIAGVSLWLATRRAPVEPSAGFPPARAGDWLVRAGFAFVLVIACAIPFIEYQAAPHGQWDAWAIWNQKARFMFRAGPSWTDSMAIPWSQPGHPPLVAASVARLWAYGGEELTVVPALLAGTFGMAIPAVVMGALDLRRRRAWIAGSILVAPLPFAHLAAAQTADLPLALFIIATLVMLPMRPAAWRAGFDTSAAIWLAGATAGLAAWTKNEGVAFFAGSTLLVAVSVWRHGRLRDAGWWLAGATPFLVALAWFKIGVVPPQAPEYLAGAGTTATALERLLDGERLRLIAENVWLYATRWGGPAAAGSLFAVLAVAVANACRHHGRIARGFLTVSAIMAAGYATVYVLTPLDIVWLVQTTFDRLTLQLWPVLVFAACAPALVEDSLG
jgi:hypothetical protein